MTTGVPFFDIYLKSLLDPASNQHIVSKTTKIKSNRRSVMLASKSRKHKFTRRIATSIYHPSPSTTPSKLDRNADSRFLRLSHNTWLLILQHLPLIQVAELNLVCRRLFCIVRYRSRFWSHVRKILHPQLSERNLVLNGESFFDHLTKSEWLAYAKVKQSFGKVCDFCYQGGDAVISTHGSSAVLPVLSPYNAPTNTSNNTTSLRKKYLYLCLPCRQCHYLAYPEPTPPDNYITLSYDDAVHKYCLVKYSQSIPYWIREIDAFATARRLHGGDVGIQAERQLIANGVV